MRHRHEIYKLHYLFGSNERRQCLRVRLLHVHLLWQLGIALLLTSGFETPFGQPQEKLRKKKEEEEEMWREYIEQRKAQRAKEDEELRRLKERQAKRRAAREQQEAAMMEYKRRSEEQRARGTRSMDMCLAQIFSIINCSISREARITQCIEEQTYIYIYISCIVIFYATHASL